ncbi:MAG TPA: site-specific integrase [Nitrososphaeraceae archaeon]|nr:site-specific integrase [Nitrososphaeraceae archaeon]
MATKVITKTIETEAKIKKTNQVTTVTATLQQNQESDRINKSKFEAATSGLLNCYVNPLKELELKSKENAATIIDYLLAVNEETNPSNLHKKSQIITLTQLSESCCSSKNNNNKTFLQMTRDDVLTYLGKSRKPEDIDPMHKWIGTYNLRRGYLLRFFKWLYNPNLEPNKRPIPQHVIGNIPSFKRKEKSIYKPTDLWTEEDDSLFLKYCPSKRDRCYHMMSRDLSARPHEILGLKIKDVVFKPNGTQQYAEVLVNGKTGSRHIPLFLSVPYIKDWLDSHPQRGNKNTYLIPTLAWQNRNKNFGNKMGSDSLNGVYRKYKLEFFPSLLKDPKVPQEDKEKINNLLQKPFNPYIRRHSSLTEKSRILKFHTFHLHAGWTPGSQMHLKYTHYFGNESSEELLESYGVETKKDKNNLNVLKPKQCPNCNESNIPDSKFCAKCRMVLTYDAYNETLESEKQKDDKLTLMENTVNKMQSQMQSLISAFSNIRDQTQVDGMAKTLYGSGLIKEATATTTTVASSTKEETSTTPITTTD